MNHMMTPQQLLRNSEDRLRTATEAYEAANSRAERMSKRIHSGESVPDHRVDQAMRELRTARDVKERLEDEVAEMKREIARDEKIAEAQRDVCDTGVKSRAYDQVIRVGDPAMYTEHAERTGQASFLTDLYGAQIRNDSQAHERLARRGREVESIMSKRVGTTTSTVPSFVPPAYLADLFAEYSRGGRPMANLLTSLPLPATGMSITIPKVTTPSVVTTQATENTALQDTAMADTGIEVDVVTVGGYVPVSRQTLERGVLVEEMVFSDLASAYAESLDQLVIAEAVAQTGTNAITFTSASPTVAEFWPKLADAVGRVRSLRFRGPTAIVMHPRRWAWCLAALSDDDDRPLFPVSAANPMNAMGVGTSTQYDEPAGQVLGLSVYLDASIPTNTSTDQDTVFVLDGRDSVIFEEPNQAPAQLKFEAVGGSTLTVNLVAYGYSAFSFARHPLSLSKINGTGLAAPGAL